MKQKEITAAKFKAECLKLMDQTSTTYVITKRGKPVAKLLPFEEEERKLVYGCMKDSMIIHDDLIEGTGEVWDASS